MIDIINQSKIGNIASINSLNVAGDGVNKVNFEFEENQSIEKTVVVPDPKTESGLKTLLNTSGKFIL